MTKVECEICVNTAIAIVKVLNHHFTIGGTFLEKEQIESVICTGRLEGLAWQADAFEPTM